MYWEILAIRNGKAPRPLHYERIYWDLVAGGIGVEPDRPAPKGLARSHGAARLHAVRARQAPEPEKNSNELVQSETIAFNARKGLFRDSTGQFSIKRAPDLELAQRILHDAKYHEAKAAIMKPVNEFYEQVDARTSHAVNAAEHRAGLYLAAVLVLPGLVLAWLALCYVIVQRKVANLTQLERETRHLGAGTYTAGLDVDSRDEIGALTRAFIALDKVAEPTCRTAAGGDAHTPTRKRRPRRPTAPRASSWPT